MTAWEGVDLAKIRDAVSDPTRTVTLSLSRNLFGGDALVYVESIDPANPRRKPKKVLPGPLVGDSHAAMLRILADVLDGTIDSLVATDPRDEPSATVRCRECGCTDDDCSQCIAKQGYPCAWVEPWQDGVDNLCTACVP